MTFRAAHEWHKGAFIAGAQLSTCSHCSTLRADVAGRLHYVRARIADELQRVSDVSPPCLPPPAYFREPWANDTRPLPTAVVPALAPPLEPAPVRQLSFADICGDGSAA